MSFVQRKLQWIRKKEFIIFVPILLLILWLGLLSEDTSDMEEDSTTLYLPSNDGRSVNDGTWYSQLHPYEFYVYTAFYDNRTSLQSSYSQLRIIAVMETLPSGYELYCKIYYPRFARIKADLVPIGAGVDHGTKTFTEYILTCDLPRYNAPPPTVTITDNRHHLNISHVTVEVPKWPEVQQHLAVCVSVSYYSMKPHWLIEWLEIQKLLGVSMVFIYNNSVAEESSRILLEYKDEGFVDLRQSWSFIDGQDETLIHLHMSPVINDCMYRNMFTFRHFAIIDLDEIIVPRHHKLLPEMINDLPKLLRIQQVGSYIFRNAYFFFDLEPSSSATGRQISVSMKFRRRIPPSPPEYSIKSIVDSQACIAMHNHYCLKYTSEFLSSYTQIVDVDPSVALLHHYKWCHFDTYMNAPGTCALLKKTSVFDDVMLKYQQMLLRKLKTQYSKFGLHDNVES